MSVARLLERKEVCVVAGSGGVGKTTTSAAVAAGMARLGRKVIVLTIDPARRLANALGLDQLGNEEHRVEGAPRRWRDDPVGTSRDYPSGTTPRGADGELWAMMLDAKRTFDELVEWHAPDPETRDAVLGNRIYQQLSNAVAGSQEYMAMEKLHELHQEGRYDLLVLDTPPTRSALDFLDAPRRLSAFIDSRGLQFFSAPSLFGLRALGRGSGLVFGALRRATGVDLLQDLSGFFRSFGDMAEGFRDRARRVDALLSDSRTTFLLVTSPRRAAVDEAAFFHHRLLDSGMPFGGVVVNRMHPVAPASAGEVVELLGEHLGGKVARNLEDFRRLAERDRRNLAALGERLGRTPMIEVPELDDDVHDLDGLARMNEHLFR